MTPETAERLLALNRAFYDRVADSFARTRAAPQPGFAAAAAWLPTGRLTVLDAGCGEGRFGRFLAAQGRLGAYVGLDMAGDLLRHARRAWPAEGPPARFLQRDLLDEACFRDLPPSAVVVCLAVLQHIPGVARRAALLSALGRQVRPGGGVLLSTWQFADAPRQRRKIAPWALAGLADGDVEPGDYLLTWQGDPQALRYVARIDETALAALAADAGLRLQDTLRADGREGDLNLYAWLTPL